MSSSKRDLANPPSYYYDLTPKQQSNWRRATRKIGKNDELKRQLPPFCSSSKVVIVHLHYQTKMHTIEELIKEAAITTRYTIDTECDKTTQDGALVQIQFVHSIDRATVILIEVNHLPDRHSILFGKIRQLCSTIMNPKNEIISWGPVEKEFQKFDQFGLFVSGNIKNGINLQSRFREWHNRHETHPEREGRGRATGGKNIDGSNCDCGHHTHMNPKLDWSLQDAVKSALNQHLDKTETLNNWAWGVDPQLRSRSGLSLEKRVNMINYAVADCLSVTELYFLIYPPGQSINHVKFATPTPIHVETQPEYALSDISEDEFEEFQRQQQQQHIEIRNDLTTQTLTLQVTEEEMAEFDTEQPQQPVTNEQQPEEQPMENKPKRTPAEKQRWKNTKLKMKQRTRPDFQNWIKRPIYHRYNYQTIRAQLQDDNLYPSHQTTINRERTEVKINFKSAEERQKAQAIVEINYFSKKQFEERWSKHQRSKKNTDQQQRSNNRR